MRDGFRFAVETAFDWADEREVGVRLRRDDDQRWNIRIAFGDVYGAFFEDVPLLIPAGGGEATKEVRDKIAVNLRKRLDSACATARASRIIYVRTRLVN